MSYRYGQWSDIDPAWCPSVFSEEVVSGELSCICTYTGDPFFLILYEPDSILNHNLTCSNELGTRAYDSCVSSDSWLLSYLLSLVPPLYLKYLVSTAIVSLSLHRFPGQVPACHY